MTELEYKKGGGESSPIFPDKIKKQRTSSKAVVIACVCVAVFVLLLLSPIFNISEITVVGNDRLDAEAVIKASGITVGTNVFKVNTAKSEKQLSTMAFVDKVNVMRKFPAKIEIHVTESKEIAYIFFIGNYVGIDETGKILEIKPKDAQLELPIILGTNVTEFGMGNQIKIDDSAKQEAIFQILKQININEMQALIKNIDVADLEDIKFFTAAESTVNIGTMDDIIYKISFLKKILEEPGDKRGAVIDMTNPEKVTYRGS
ncbi:MAG: FtsQ-type POTRA domain-containing protein [Clostridia bacterium]|nr:FtsQ-type POTRA domain-containing protein [Clostridia bacterium]